MIRVVLDTSVLVAEATLDCGEGEVDARWTGESVTAMPMMTEWVGSVLA